MPKPDTLFAMFFVVLYSIVLLMYLVLLAAISTRKFGPWCRRIAALLLAGGIEFGCAQFDAIRSLLTGQVRLR